MSQKLYSTKVFGLPSSPMTGEPFWSFALRAPSKSPATNACPVNLSTKSCVRLSVPTPAREIFSLRARVLKRVHWPDFLPALLRPLFGKYHHGEGSTADANGTDWPLMSVTTS